MFDRDGYKGREQTYLKHLVLKRYLQKWALKKDAHRQLPFDKIEAEALLFPFMNSYDLSDWLVEKKKKEASYGLKVSALVLANQRPVVAIRLFFSEKGYQCRLCRSGSRGGLSSSRFRA